MPDRNDTDHVPTEPGVDRRDFIKRSAAVGAAAMGLSIFGLGEAPADARSRARWWGSLAQPTGSQEPWDAVRALERKVGRRFGTIHHRFPWDNDLVNKFTRWGVSTGHKPILGWNGNIGGNNLWKSIASGSQDGRITQQARSLRAAGWDTFITFHKEPEREGQPADFRAAFDRIHRIFNNVGVRKATWIVTLTAATYNAGEARQWLPRHFDLLGVDGYNRGGCGGTSWKSFNQTFAPARSFARSRNKKLYMVEVGCTEGGSGAKADWIADARATIKKWPEVVGFSYNNERTDCSYLVDSSTSALNSFKRMGADDSFRKRLN
jgi:hypothetical protein